MIELWVSFDCATTFCQVYQRSTHCQGSFGPRKKTDPYWPAITVNLADCRVMASTSRPAITLRQGIVLGTMQTTGKNHTVEAFRGIPYALPPTGDRRFRRPVKVRDSLDIIDASHYGPSAYGCKPPTSSVADSLACSEDCLTANVFRQEASKSQQQQQGPLPVMIYVHGGAFNRGTASMHDTASFVSWSEEPLVAVSFNYRHSALGFLPSGLSAEDGILNPGLWDQILLFEWIQENIAAFGGDRKNVTLVGVSAGAHSVC